MIRRDRVAPVAAALLLAGTAVGLTGEGVDTEHHETL